MTAITLGKGQNGFNLSQFAFASLVSGGAYLTNPFGSFDTWMSTTYMTQLYNDGARVFRYGVDPAPFVVNPGMTGTYLGPIFDGLAKLLNVGKFKVILDFHAQDDSKVPGYKAADILADPVKFAALIEAEKQTAVALQTFHPNAPVALGILNEVPGDKPNWPTQAKQITSAIRTAVGPGLTLVVGGDNWAGPVGLQKINPTQFDSNIIWDVHSYLWQPITHQATAPSAMGPDSCIPYLSRISLPRNVAEKAVVIARAKANIDAQIWGPISNGAALKTQVDDFMRIWFDDGYGADLRIDYDPVAAWAANYGVPSNRIHFGEVGIWGDSGGKQGADLASRVNYLKAHREQCDARGYSFTVWDLCNPNTAWRCNSAVGVNDIEPSIKAALFGMPKPLPHPAPPTVLTPGTYTVPSGSTITVA